MPYLDTQNKYIANAIKTARIKHNWTQLDLAIKAKTTQSTIAKIERGTYGQWSYSLLCKVAQVLGMIMDIKFMDINNGKDN